MHSLDTEDKTQTQVSEQVNICGTKLFPDYVSVSFQTDSN